MSTLDPQHAWQEYCDRELSLLSPILAERGFVLDEKQPHLGGERYLMQALASVSGRKVILLGQRLSDGLHVVIKASSESGGRKELEHEHACRTILDDIKFAYETFLSPEELLFIDSGPLTLSITRFIEQESAFLARPLREQFLLAISAFKAQESAHATTWEHYDHVSRYFDTIDSAGYCSAFRAFETTLREAYPDDATLTEILVRGASLLSERAGDIERYCGFLTHVDFVPHNIRIAHGEIYLLDHSSLRFGNKYEGWARFLNFMLLYNPELERALVEYVRLNRTPEESEVLRLMRVFRLGEMLVYYLKTLDRSSGDLLTLNTARLDFWKRALQCMVENVPFPDDVRTTYIALRDSLRSPAEVERQKDLH